MEIPWPALPDGALAWHSFGLSAAYVVHRMPDGTCFEGRGPTMIEADADAFRRWRHWKRGHPGPLAVDGREYRRRLRARRRRHGA